MKVNFVTTYPPTNCGIAIHSSYLIEALRKKLDVNVVPIQVPMNNLRYFVDLAKQSRREADVVHVQYNMSFFGNRGIFTPIFYFFLKLRRGPPVVTTVHEFIDVKKAYPGKLRQWLMRQYYRIIFGSLVLFSDKVIIHSNSVVHMLSQYWGIRNLEVMPLASHVVPVLLPADECKSRLGIGKKRMLTMFGYVHPHKGVDLAIETIREMPEDVVLYIAGDGRTPGDKDYVRRLKELVASTGLGERVLFHGYVDDRDMATIMNATDIFLMPYLHLMQSASLNFSLAYQKPVVASDLGEFSEIAREFGCIVVFTPGNKVELTQKLLALLSDRGQTGVLKEKARAYMSTVSISAAVERTLKVYGDVTGHGLS